MKRGGESRFSFGTRLGLVRYDTTLTVFAAGENVLNSHPDSTTHSHTPPSHARHSRRVSGFGSHFLQRGLIVTLAPNAVTLLLWEIFFTLVEGCFHFGEKNVSLRLVFHVGFGV